ncbi:SPOR domain-containing protein [Marinithermus hydrothermalis]|uniref:Sporulation domain-containing protein n=1 Tax=Marinithermus hydrothermalis (strain DSM 14884 / JCM 11576 / T1) TaxID=869210 RepID=F2NM83_MARHT|nr:SPOR domain-containing protein [Marinithermus hydrothermalis]AEB11553.1 Sporulation domain-containing protein [Marinithermus hydrothermalis DSM 14884]
MRWLRENWIDALVFSLFALVVVGIVLFLTGVNPFQRESRAVRAATPTPQSPATETVAAPPTAAPAPQPPAAPESSREATATEPTPEAPAVTVLPLPPAIEEASPPNRSAGGTTVATRQPPTPSPSTVTPAPAATEREVFRVAVGSFSNPQNALRLAQKLEEAGYPVRLEPIGRLTRVVVGPYAERAQAEAAHQALRLYEPQIYKGDSPEVDDTYFQVGAYRDLAVAEALVKRLRDADYPVVLSYRSGLLRVWVGPLAPEQVEAVRNGLEGMGLEVVEAR